MDLNYRNLVQSNLLSSLSNKLLVDTPTFITADQGHWLLSYTEKNQKGRGKTKKKLEF